MKNMMILFVVLALQTQASDPGLDDIHEPSLMHLEQFMQRNTKLCAYEEYIDETLSYLDQVLKKESRDYRVFKKEGMSKYVVLRKKVRKNIKDFHADFKRLCQRAKKDLSSVSKRCDDLCGTLDVGSCEIMPSKHFFRETLEALMENLEKYKSLKEMHMQCFSDFHLQVMDQYCVNAKPCKCSYVVSFSYESMASLIKKYSDKFLIYLQDESWMLDCRDVSAKLSAIRFAEAIKRQQRLTAIMDARREHREQRQNQREFRGSPWISPCAYMFDCCFVVESSAEAFCSPLQEVARIIGVSISAKEVMKQGSDKLPDENRMLTDPFVNAKLKKVWEADGCERIERHQSEPRRLPWRVKIASLLSCCFRSHRYEAYNRERKSDQQTLR